MAQCPMIAIVCTLVGAVAVYGKVTHPVFKGQVEEEPHTEHR